MVLCMRIVQGVRINVGVRIEGNTAKGRTP